MLFRRRDNHPTEEDLSAYLDGELASGPMTSISQHLRACDACSTRLESLGATKAALSELPRLQPSRSFALGPEFARERRRAPQPKRSPFVFAPAVALMVFVALVAVDLTSSISTSMDESGAGLSLESAKSADDAAAGAPAARNSAGQAAGSANVVPPSASPAPAAAAGETQTFSAPTTTSPVPTPGQPERTADLPPPRTGQPQAADAAAPAPIPRADSAEGVASSTASTLEEFSTENRGYPSDGTDWLRLLQIGAFAAFVVSLVAVGWPRLRSRGRT